MTLFLQLLLAHFIGDFLLQRHDWVIHKENKKWSSKYLYFHILIHGILVLVITGTYTEWKIALFIAITHLIIDGLKLQRQKDNTRRGWFFADQLLHILMIWLVCLAKEELDFDIGFLHQRDSLMVIVGAFFLLTPCSYFVKTFISKWSPVGSGSGDKSLQEAGKIIGMIERGLIFIFIFQNQWEAIGFLLAAKSVFRFGELKTAHDRKLTEYILIGTLVSFGIAVAVGLAVKNWTTF